MMRHARHLRRRHRRHLRPAAHVVLAIFALVAVGLSVNVAFFPAQLRTPDAEPVSSTASVSLPFDLPPAAELRSSPKLAFAHYWPALPVSIDNQPLASDYYARNYLNPGGESGKHESYGGHLRDRPIPRDPRSQSDWRLLDVETEVRQAVAAGLDGFALDILQLPGGRDTQVWNTEKLVLRGAHAVDPGFKVMLMPDISGSLRHRSKDELAKYVAELGASPSAFRLADGRLVVSPFDAENHTVGWWTHFMSIMKHRYGLPVAFVPVFQDEAKHSAAFAPISYGMSHWGARNPGYNDPLATYSTSRLGRAAAIHRLGKKWMQPVSVQDERPNQGIFDEAENTTNLRDTWKIAIDSHSEWVQMTTWNDYTEGTAFAPSVNHGWAYLDISAFYLTWFKTGRAPRIVRDTVYLTHRTQPVKATPVYRQSKLMSLRGGSPARDTVEALTFLTAPATVTVTVGARSYRCAAAAGVDHCTVPLGEGRVSVRVTRGRRAVAQVRSPYLVTATPYVQDLGYVAVSSRRSTKAALPEATPATSARRPAADLPTP